MKEESQPEFPCNFTDDIMDNDYHESRTFKEINFNQFELDGHTFENCIFQSCHFNEMSLSKVVFINSTFLNCELILVKVDNMTLNKVKFAESKIMGINFKNCNKLGFLPEFENCLIDSTVFYLNNFKKGKFINSHIKNSDFIECDLRDTDFCETKFEKTNFQKCNLEKADFRYAYNYSINPFENKILKGRFALPEAQSFLEFLGINLD